MKKTLAQKHFTVVPQKGLPKHLHQKIQRDLIKELIEIIKQSELSLGIKLTPVINKIKLFRTNKIINPNLFGIYASLVRATKNGDEGLLKDTIKNFVLLPDKNFFVKGFSIVSFDFNDYADKEVYEYVFSPQGPRSKKGALPRINSVGRDILNNESIYINKAIGVLSKCTPGIFEEFREYVNSVSLFKGTVLVGITSMRSFGRIHLKIPGSKMTEVEKIAYYVEHLVHETSHLHLHGIMMYDPLILNKDDERYPAPIRVDLRPMYGIYHATFVLNRMKRVFEQWLKYSKEKPVEKYFKTFSWQLKNGIKTVGENGKFTSNGKILFETILTNSN